MSDRSYTNSDGVLVEVSKQHLDCAVAIKKELQNSSPSRKCAWLRHKQLMMVEGFEDSDTNENYRCLIKSYQRKVGLLESVGKRQDVVTLSRLESIRNAVGELYLEKRENQLVLRDINKVKRELSTVAVVAEEVRDAFLDEIEINVPHFVFQPRLTKGDNEAILVITDWHIGLVIDNVKGNSYNYEIAKKRVEKLKQETLQYCSLFGVGKLHVCMLGDAIEHVSMRNINQAKEVEFHYSQQIVKATKLIAELIVNLAEYIDVEYQGIGGNHDRINGIKENNIDGDNAVVVINDNIQMMIEMIKSPNLKYISNDMDNNTDEIVKEIKGKKFKMVHGDLESRNGDNKIRDHIVTDNEFYDALIMGHYHHFKMVDDNFGKMNISVGCLFGMNNYSKKLKYATNASQALIIISEDKIIPLKIDLQIV